MNAKCNLLTDAIYAAMMEIITLRNILEKSEGVLDNYKKEIDCLQVEIKEIIEEIPEIRYLKDKAQEIRQVLEEFCDGKRDIANAMYGLQEHDSQLFEALGCFKMEEVFLKQSK